MTQRERQANDGATVPTLTPPSAQVESCASAVASGNVSSATALETQLRRTHPLKQIALLSYAARNGLLFDSRENFPVGANRNGKIEFERWNLLSRLAAGKTDALQPTQIASLDFVDAELDDWQRHAVAVSMQTPDVAVVTGLPGTGKSRVVAEIVSQAVRKGERVLFLAPCAAAVDHVLHRLADCDDMWAYRCVAGKPQDAMLHTVRLMTGPAQRERYRQVAEQAANTIQTEAENHRRQRGQDEKRWPNLRHLAEQLTDLQESISRLSEQHAKLHDEISLELADSHGPLATKLKIANEKFAHEASQITERLESAKKSHHEITDKLESISAELEILGPLADAKQKSRWWTWRWWRATLRGNVLATCATLEKEKQEHTERLKLSARLEQEITAEQHSLELRIRDEVIDAETQMRAEKIQTQIESLDRRHRELMGHWHDYCNDLHESHRPREVSCRAVDEARAAWERSSNPEENCRYAREWAERVGKSAAHIDDCLTQWTNVVAGPIDDFLKDSHFQTVSPQFDVLILEDAERLAESDFLQLGRWAKRWVLVGEAAWEGVRRETSDSLLQQMWRHFHCDPRRLPFRWSKHNGKLCCQLRPIDAQHRQWLETESVADSPEIELRIVSPPRDEPFLAEVVFPGTTNIVDAKQFLYRETDEVAVQTHSSSWIWRQNNDGWTLEFSAETGGGEEICVELESGICEWVHAANYRTTRLEFYASAGWRRGRVEDWLRDRLQMHDLQRTAFLSVPYRMETNLSKVLSDLLFDGAYVSNQNGVARTGDFGCGSQPVEFVPIPPLRRERGSRHHSEHRTLLPKDGAGLEVNLKTDRFEDRLPKDVAANLPRNGFVNIEEAQAVVRKLEQIAANAVSQNGGDAPAVVVLAMYDAQAELIRRYIDRSSVLKRSALATEVGTPQDFRHREMSVVLVSLTRSHPRRAVSFGDGESHMVLAMTRARHRLILFGDPGTLFRRSQWSGGNPDRMNAASAAREKKVITELVRYLQGQGRFAHAFRLCDD